MIHKRLPFGVFIAEGRAFETAKFWANPSLNKIIEIPRHKDHLSWAMHNVKKLQLPKASVKALDDYKKMAGTAWKGESWAETFQDFFMNGWVRMVGHIDMKVSKGDDEVLSMMELHGYKQSINRMGRFIESKFPLTSEFCKMVMIEEEFTDCRMEKINDPLRLRRFFKGGKIQ